MPETCPHCGCGTTSQTARTPIDRSLAFTAMLERYPGFGQMTDAEAGPLIDEFLADWYRSGHTDMYAYAGEWAGRDRAKTQPVTGAPQPDVHGIRAETARMRDSVMEDIARHDASGNPYQQYTPEARVWDLAAEHGRAAAGRQLEGTSMTSDGWRHILSRIPEWRSHPGLLTGEPQLHTEAGNGYTRAAMLAAAGWVPHDGTALADDLATQYTSQARTAYWNEIERMALAELPHRQVDSYTQLGNRFITCACGTTCSGGMGDTIAQQNFDHHLRQAREAVS